MHLLKQSNDLFNLHIAAAKPPFQILPDLIVVKRQQGTGSVLRRGSPLTIATKKQAVLFKDIPEVMGAATDQNLPLLSCIIFFPDLPDTPELGNKLVGLLQRKMNRFFIEPVEENYCPVLTHQLDNILWLHTLLMERIFCTLNGIFKDIKQFWNPLFRANTGCHHPQIDVNTKRIAIRLLMVQGIKLPCNHPAGKGLARAKIAKQGKKWHIRLQNPAFDIVNGVYRITLDRGIRNVADIAGMAFRNNIILVRVGFPLLFLTSIQKVIHQLRSTIMPF